MTIALHVNVENFFGNLQSRVRKNTSGYLLCNSQPSQNLQAGLLE